MTDITEEQARQMEAGPELDRLVLTGFFGWEAHDTCGHRKMDGRSTTTAVLFGPESDFDLFGTIRCNAKSPPPFSTDWSAAGPLLEAMNDISHIIVESIDYDEWVVTAQDLEPGPGIIWEYSATAPTPKLAIARACAVLVACGITRDDLEVR